MTSKTVLITGCSEGGIGSALALAFQAHGLHVFATTRSLPKMAHLSKFPNITLLSLDVTSSSDISAAVNAVKFHPGNNGKLDYLINNAGRNFFMPTLDIDIAEAKKIYETKFWGPLALIKAFAPLVIKAKGTIVNNCSISGHVNVPFMGLYSASKISLEMLSETLRLEMTPFGVNVVEIITGAVVSQGQTYFTDLKLPSNSKYLSIEDTIVKRAQGSDGHARMPTEKYAQGVVDGILGGATGRVWYGNDAESIKAAVVGQVPQETMDIGMIQGCSLDKITVGL